MSRISIVGVDGSGKTVLMAAFGEKYERPDGYGYFLSANTPQTFHTVKMLMDRMRHGQWPNATGAETVTNLEWSLLQRKGTANESICSVSFLDYAGEIYRLAFGEHTDEERKPFEEQIKTLHEHVSSSDALLVLINLKDIVSGDLAQAKTRETLWISRNIFDYAVEKHPGIRMALAFSQFDVYRTEIAHVGGLQAAYKKYLSHIESLYPEMQLLSVSAVNQTTVNEDGFEIPAENFESEGLDNLLEWIISTVPGHEGEVAYRRNLPTSLWKRLADGRESLDSGTISLNAKRLQLLDELVACLEEFRRLPEQERRSVASDEKITVVSQYLERETSKARAFEDVLSVAQKNGLDAAEDALRTVAERETCTHEDLTRVRDEITAVVEESLAAARKARFRRRMLAAGITISLAAAGIFGGIKVKENIEAERERVRIQREAEERRRQIAEQQELDRKKNAGYEIEQGYGKKTARWKAGRVPPANANLITTSSQDEYRATRAGYEWVKGTLNDAWKPGLAHPDKDDVVAGEREGQWVSTKPGYAVDGNFNIVWQSGLRHPQNSRLRSTSSEGCWESTEAGWKWDGGSRTSWQVGAKHPNDSKLVSSNSEGKWESSEPGYEWDGGDRAVWKSGSRHPQNMYLVSSDSEGQWESTRGEGWVWDGGTGVKWQAGIKSVRSPHWVTVEKENHARPEPGYKKKDETASGWCELVWAPGTIDESSGTPRKASSVEGRWLGKIDCTRCDGSGYVSGTKDCDYCDGTGRCSGSVTCSNCSGTGKVNGSESCSQCNGNGFAWFTCSQPAHQMACFNCGGSKFVNFGFGPTPCGGCLGQGHVPCFVCGNNGRVFERCNRCGGSRRVQAQVDCGRCNGSGSVSGRVSCSHCSNGRVSCRKVCPASGCVNGKVWESE